MKNVKKRRDGWYLQDRGSTIYGGLAGTYLGQRLLSVARGAPGFSRTRHYVIKDD